MDRLLSMRTFARVVDAGSFAGAARELDLNQAAVTRLIADLEQHLGARLLHRTTRSLHLTDAGAAYLARCRGILAEVDEAEALVRQGQDEPAGKVRIALPPLFGTDVLPQTLKALRERHPKVVLEVALLDRPVDLVAEGFDLAVLTPLQHTAATANMVSRPMFDMAFSLCAAPSYLKQHRAPRTPAELSTHDCIGMAHAPLGDRWVLQKSSGGRESVAVNIVLWAGDMHLMRQAVRSGIGIGVMSQWAIRADQEKGLLLPVLQQWQLGSLSFSLVYPGREFQPARVRAVIDFVLSENRRAREND